jgi:hypothetical protein
LRIFFATLRGYTAFNVNRTAVEQVDFKRTTTDS